MPANARLSPHTRTSYPDSYIDTVIRGLLRDGSYINALMRKDRAAWEERYVKIYQQVSRILHRYRFLPLKIPFDELVLDMTNHCAGLLFLRLPTFPFDTEFDGWSHVLFKREISTVRYSADFRWNNFAKSLETSSTSESDDLSLLDTLVDTDAEATLRKRELMAVLATYLPQLSKDQREVIQRGLRGEETGDIARDMQRTHEAVYSLRYRAVRNLRCLLSDN